MGTTWHETSTGQRRSPCHQPQLDGDLSKHSQMTSPAPGRMEARIARIPRLTGTYPVTHTLHRHDPAGEAACIMWRSVSAVWIGLIGVIIGGLIATTWSWLAVVRQELSDAMVSARLIDESLASLEQAMAS